MTEPNIPLKEFQQRRNAVLRKLKDRIGVIYAGAHDDALHGTYRPHPNFEYLTGVVDEPDAMLVLDPTAPVEARKAMLFLRPLNPELEQWDGLRLGISKELRDNIGMNAVFRMTSFARFVTEAASRAKRFGCLHPFAWIGQPPSADLQLFRELGERIPNIVIDDCTNILANARAKKSRAELNIIEQASRITAMGYDNVLKTLTPGMNEFDVQETLEHTYRSNGSRGPAYNTIAGGGLNATVLHYNANDQPLEDGDLICIDSGALFGGYGADVTRTFPVNGTFTKRQAEIYNIVLKAMTASLKAVKPGATMSDVDRASRAIITKAGYGDYFIHGIGHHLGLETHDITPDGPLKVGNVVTVEPGIYLPDEKIGVRIEDDVVVTTNGHRNLTSGIPKTIAAIEKAMKR